MVTITNINVQRTAQIIMNELHNIFLATPILRFRNYTEITNYTFKYYYLVTNLYTFKYYYLVTNLPQRGRKRPKRCNNKKSVL